MIGDLPLVDQVWYFSLVIAIITGSLAILVLLGPGWLRDARAIFAEALPTAEEVARARELDRREALLELGLSRPITDADMARIYDAVMRRPEPR